MYLLLGNSQMERSDYDGAIKSFEHARAQMRHNEGWSLSVVSLVSFLVSVLHRIQVASDRYPDGNLMISTSRFNSVCVTPYMQRVARMMHANIFSKL